MSGHDLWNVTALVGLLTIAGILWKVFGKLRQGVETIEKMPQQLTALEGKVDTQGSDLVLMKRDVGNLAQSVSEHRTQTRDSFEKMERRLGAVEGGVEFLKGVQVGKGVDGEKKRDA